MPPRVSPMQVVPRSMSAATRPSRMTWGSRWLMNQDVIAVYRAGKESVPAEKSTTWFAQAERSKSGT